MNYDTQNTVYCNYLFFKVINMSDIKEICEEATKFIESCFDENNPNDGLTFDERLARRTKELKDENIKKVINKAVEDPL